jgi:hypothetical protein
MGANCLLRLNGLPPALLAAQPPSTLPLPAAAATAAFGCAGLPSSLPTTAAVPDVRPATGDSAAAAQDARSGDVVPDTAALPLLLLPLPKRGLYGKLPPALDARLRGTVVRLVSVFDSDDICTHRGIKQAHCLGKHLIL